MYQENEVSRRQQLQNQPNQTTAKSKSFNFHWEKRHWILVIGITCLVFWYFVPQVKTTPWLQSSLNFLPLIGGLSFALETILKLSQ